MAYIEFIGNKTEISEKNKFEAQVNEHKLQPYWTWEHKILLQEKQYWEGLLQTLKMQVDTEVEKALEGSQ